MPQPEPIAFIDLAAQQARIRERIDARIAAVLAHGKYIMGPEVGDLESRLAAFSGAKHALTCANGTDALQLALMALGVKAGDAVFVPSFTFAATAEIVPFLGATPVFVDIDPSSFNLDPDSLGRAVSSARGQGLKPAVVIAVDLFGLPADYDAIEAVARAEGLKAVADSAQAFGASYKGRRTGTIGHVTTTSFFPAKPLGCYGDGGAIFTEDDELAALMRSYRMHGKGSDKYDNVRVGMNSRLDTLQAAILIEKLAVYEEEIELRQTVAERYRRGLTNALATPSVDGGSLSVWAQYTVTLPPGTDRPAIQAELQEAGVPSVVYYPLPLHLQSAYRDFPIDPNGLSVSEDMASRVLSLPMHPYLSEDQQERIIKAVNAAVAADRR